MKKRIIICLVALVLILSVGLITWPAGNDIGQNQTTPSSCQTDPAETEFWQEDQVPGSDIAQTNPTQNESGNDLEQPDQTDPPESIEEPDSTQPTQSKNPTPKPTRPKETEPKPTTPKPSAPKPTEPPVVTAPAQTEPVQTPPAATVPEESEPRDLTPPITAPAETEPEETIPETTEPAAPEITYEFKREVASYAAQYINQYRGSACTILPGMSQVAQYRAGQLTRNYGHSTADKRAALAHFEYGRYIDATEFGDDPSNSYWEADSAEAICAGFYGTDPKAMGKKIADLIRNSSGHWSYISSSEYSYMGVGVEYREGTEYGWYACVMVGSVNYG